MVINPMQNQQLRAHTLPSCQMMQTTYYQSCKSRPSVKLVVSLPLKASFGMLRWCLPISTALRFTPAAAAPGLAAAVDVLVAGGKADNCSSAEQEHLVTTKAVLTEFLQGLTYPPASRTMQQLLYPPRAPDRRTQLIADNMLITVLLVLAQGSLLRYIDASMIEWPPASQ